MVCNITEGVKLGSLLQVLDIVKRDGTILYTCSGVSSSVVTIPKDHCIILSDQLPLTADFSSVLRALLSISLWSNSLSTSLLEGNQERASSINWMNIFWNLLPSSSRTIPMNWIIMSSHPTMGISMLQSLADARTKDLISKRSGVFQRFSSNEEFLQYLFEPVGKIGYTSGIRAMVRRKSVYEFAVVNDRRSAVIVNHENSVYIGSVGTISWTSKGLSLHSNGEVVPVEQDGVVVIEEADSPSMDTSVLVKLKILLLKHGIEINRQGGKPFPQLFLDRFVQLLTPSECKSSLARILYSGLSKSSLRIPTSNLWLSGAVLSGIEVCSIFDDLALDRDMIEAKRSALTTKRTLTRYNHEDH